MEKAIYYYNDYKKYLLDRLESSPNQGRGLRRKMAEAMGCQVAYVSHVLAADRHLSLEQAEALSRFFSMRSDEAEVFLLLVEYNRAGTSSLSQFFEKQLNKRREEYGQLKSRLQIKSQISKEDQAIYYSIWHYQAIHTILTIKEFRNPIKISEKLNLSVQRVNEVLTFLLERGLVKDTKEGYIPTSTQIHLGSDSPLISKLHGNWRVQTLNVLGRNRKEDLNYTGLVTLAKDDYFKVREILTKAIESSLKVVVPSKEEKICLFSLDYYEL